MGVWERDDYKMGRWHLFLQTAFDQGDPQGECQNERLECDKRKICNMIPKLKEQC